MSFLVISAHVCRIERFYTDRCVRFGNRVGRLSIEGEEWRMAVKQMKKNKELFSGHSFRGSLEVHSGLVVRFVFAGTPTLYIYGEHCGETDSEISVRRVDDQEFRASVRQEVALSHHMDLCDVVWTGF